MCNVVVCPDCYRAKDFCTCETVEMQSGEFVENTASTFRREWDADSTPTQLNLEGLSKWTLFELYFYQKIIDGNHVDFSLIDFCFPWLKDFSMSCIMLYWASAFFFSYMLNTYCFISLVCFVLLHFLIVRRLSYVITAHIDKPIHINSGYRCKELNKAVGGTENSYHMKGLAVDFRTDSKEDIPKMYNFLQRNIKRLNIQELIKYDTFIHMAIKP